MAPAGAAPGPLAPAPCSLPGRSESAGSSVTAHLHVLLVHPIQRPVPTPMRADGFMACRLPGLLASGRLPCGGPRPELPALADGTTPSIRTWWCRPQPPGPSPRPPTPFLPGWRSPSRTAASWVLAAEEGEDEEAQ